MTLRTKSNTRAAPFKNAGKPPRLDLKTFLPFYLAATLNRFIASSSKIYLDKFGCGMTEWRVLSMLALKPERTAAEICDASGMDKANVSRALKALSQRDLLTTAPSREDQRRSLVSLTREGLALHDRMIVTVLEHEELFLTGFSKKERKLLVELHRRLLGNIALIDARGKD